MLRFSSCNLRVLKADAIKNKLIARVKDVEKKNTILFIIKASIVIISLNS
jgi:hypothetical protein